MNKKGRVFGLVMAFSAMLLPANAQEDISSIMKAGVADMNKLAEGYMKPAGVGFSAGLGSNWYNTAATHKLLGFDLTVGANVAMTPTADQTFSVLGFDKLRPTSSTVTTAPTFGGDGKGVELQIAQPNTINGLPNPYAGQLITKFNTPDGISKYVPTANLQFTLGLPLGNDLSLRLVPTVKTNGFESSLWGLAVKHDVKQWIPVVKSLPFDASVLVGYTDFSMNYAFEQQLKPTDMASNPAFIKDNSGVADWSNAGQGIKVNANALTANLIVSKKLAFFTPYVGVGFTKANFDMSFTGKYPLLGNPITTPGADFGKLSVTAMNDPIKLSYSEFMPGATVGFRMKILFIFALHAQYTMQKYPTASVGFGINIR